MPFIRNMITNNAMKKVIAILAVLFLVMGIYAQRATVISGSLTAINVDDTNLTADTTEFPPIQGEYDVSLQFIPAAYGAGSATSFTYVVYQSNSDVDAVWTAITTSAAVTSLTDADAISTITDFKGLRLRVICAGTDNDTCTVTPYYVFKKHDNE